MFDSLFRDRGFSFDRLRALLEVHDAGSIIRAAGGNAVRQSQYSRQMRELAEYFGCEMVVRKGKVVKLTRDGIRLADMARLFLRMVEDLRSETKREPVNYSLGAGDSLIQWLLIPRLGEIWKAQPMLRFAIQNLRTDEIVHQLVDSRIEFGLLRRNAILSNLKTAPLGRLRYSLIIPTNLVKKGMNLTFEQAMTLLPIAAQSTDGEFSTRLRTLSTAVKFPFHPTLSCQSFTQVSAAIRSGRFAGILPEVTAEQLLGGSYLKLDSPLLKPFTRDIVLAWNPRLIAVRPSAAKVLALLQTKLRF